MRQLLDYSARPFVRLVAVIVLLCSTHDVAAVDPCTDTSGHKVSFVTVAADVRVEVLDWGGDGPPLILLAGLGNTAHVFDHFAHQFTYGFHVIGITRRGFGASTHPKSGYDYGTRAHDVLMVFEKLHFDRAVLIGHSIAGDEVTKFATTYPNRTSALVYIDAAYNRTKVQQLLQLPQPEPTHTDHDFASVENWNADVTRDLNGRPPNTEVCNTRFVSSDGHVGQRKTLDDIADQFVKLAEPPQYTKVQAPALALYAREDAHRIFPAYDEYSEESKARVDRLTEMFRLIQEDAIKQFKAEVARAQVEVLDGAHYLFLTNEAEVVWLTRIFLKKVTP